MSESKRVFVVHGHDEIAKHTIARFIEQFGYEAVILHERTNQGRTIIEKFEANADAAFAIVLLTPDDEGGKAGGPSKPRVRQNVVFELGYFIGALKRNRVCALVKGEVELPSDIHGVVYQTMDDGGAWKLPVAREMKDAGLDIDMNKAR